MLALASNVALGTGDFIYACVDGATGTPDAAYALGIRPTYGSSGATDYCVGAMPGWEYHTPDHSENACCRMLADGLTSLSIELYDMNIFTANDITGRQDPPRPRGDRRADGAGRADDVKKKGARRSPPGGVETMERRELNRARESRGKR